MKTINYQTDLCVVGGGLSGICAAIAAARHGIKVVLIQDRAVLGGNASSEIRMWICGAQGKDNKETGIIEELQLENFYRNPSLKYPLWDLTLYEKVKAEKNITMLLNSAVFDADCEDGRINSVKAWQSNAETFHVVTARYFADCSGDSILAPLSGAAFRYGREAKHEFDETIPPDVADKKTMGMSCLFQIRETDHPVPFVAPDNAYRYESDADLPYKDHGLDNNYWWIELGGEWDCIHDSDRCRDELIKICLGVWDHMKNRGDHGADNWELDWIGFLPGKRESRRYVGEYTVTQNDVEAEGRFEDLVAYAGWSMDDHFPQGFYYTAGHPTIYHPAPRPWGLPLRAMISQNIRNLVFAGRNISVTHAALSSCRVMGTCGILGQALGTAVALAVKENTDIRTLPIKELQDMLMDDDCFLPWHRRTVSPLSLAAACTSETVRNGCERGEENCWQGVAGDAVTYRFDEDTPIRQIRLVFDSDLNRGGHNMLCYYPLGEAAYKLPQTLIKEFSIVATAKDGTQYTLDIHDNHQRFVKLAVDLCVSQVSFVPKSTYGAEKFRLFAFEVS